MPSWSPRGDLGVRLPIEEVPHLQKEIVLQGIRYARPVVGGDADARVNDARPGARHVAEVTDVANAVLDGASAVMLSGETAIGDDPVGVVVTMDRIIRRAEKSFELRDVGRDARDSAHHRHGVARDSHHGRNYRCGVARGHGRERRGHRGMHALGNDRASYFRDSVHRCR